MNKKEKIAFALVAAIAMTSGGFAFGQSVNNVSSDQVIYACVTGVNGNITKVSNTPKTCPRGTTPLSWNMVGPKGDQGIQGVPGVQGIPGAKGEPGQNSLSGESKPGVLLVNPDETIKLPVITIPIYGTMAFVQYSGNWWGIGQNGEISAGMNFNQIPIQAFQSSDCSGTPRTLVGKNYAIFDNVIYSDGFQPIGRFDRGFEYGVKLKKSAVPFSQLHSYLTQYEWYDYDKEMGGTIDGCFLIREDGQMVPPSDPSNQYATINDWFDKLNVYDFELIQRPSPYLDWHFEIG